jgi:hypothetical protein
VFTSLFRAGAIEAAFALASHLFRYPQVSVADAERQLRRGPAQLATLDYGRGRELLDLLGQNTFEAGLNTTALRDVLLVLSRTEKPAWIYGAPAGRDWCRRSMDADTIQVIEQAKLFGTDVDAMTWWDELASIVRKANDEGRLRAGREGELLTLAHETQVLQATGIVNREPRWIAIEDNTRGFDIESWRRSPDGQIQPIWIEVKAHSGSSPSVFLTRREWDVATSARSRYIFYVWNLETRALHTMGVDEMEESIPVDRGNGRWQQTLVTL